MKHLPLRELGYAIAFIITAFAAYTGSYFLLVEREDNSYSLDGPKYHHAVNYRFPETESLFRPAVAIDRMLRPKYWEPDATTLLLLKSFH
jgi:hypothetical protein